MSSTRSHDISIADWSDLFDAVEARLRLTVGERLDAASSWPDAKHQVRTSVLECVSALEQLHATLSHELARFRQLEAEVLVAAAASKSNAAVSLPAHARTEPRSRAVGLLHGSHDGL